MSDEEARPSLPIGWVGVEKLDLLFANQFIVQLDPDGSVAYFTAGAVVPPAILGSPEEQAAQVAAVGFVPVKPVVRLGITKQKFTEIRRMFDLVADHWDTIAKGEGGTE